ncbi:MAG: DNA-3-methyladenine glycosylase I [Acidobacteriota bacterium]
MYRPGPPVRCGWVTDDPLYVAYHDDEWGVPERRDGRLFEMLILEGAQAGLSWITILKKREGYRRAFHNFDAEKVAAMTEADQARLREDASIVRNRLKIKAAVTNARAYLDLRSGRSSFSDFLWDFVDGEPVQNAWRRREDVPASTPVSDVMSKALKREGFTFVGSTICYAFMQATGMVNDHTTDCFRYAECARLAGKA